MSASPAVTSRYAALLDNLGQAVDQLGIYPPDAKLPNEMSIRELRRRRGGTTTDAVGTMVLTEVGGVLQWEEGLGGTPLSGRRRAGIGTPGATGDIVAQYKFEKLEPSKVGEFLETLDNKLTPQRGLRICDSSGLLQPLAAPLGKRILLLIHGTFSNSENLISEIRTTDKGKDLLGKAVTKQYDQVLTFDHPTLAVSPILNALDLARLFRQSGADVDVVCHSRGGLVTRWWFEALTGNPMPHRRAVLVGAPLAGTSLAAPPRLRAALNLITNVGRALTSLGGAASAAVPLLTVATGVLRVISSVTSFAAKTPLIDAVVAMIPGIAGMSAVGNSPELRRLRSTATAPFDYYAVCSNFEPTDPGWAFWRYFMKVKDRMADVAADIVFDGDNDLVVDKASMTNLTDSAGIPPEKVLDFGKTDRVHHTNYFEQEETINFIAQSLGIW